MVGLLLVLCVLLAGCQHEPIEKPGCMDETATNYDPDATQSDETQCEYSSEDYKVPDNDPPNEIEQPPEDDGNEAGGDDGDDNPDEGDEDNADSGDEEQNEEPTEQPDSDGDGVIDEEDQCPGEDDTVDEDESGEPDCTENQT